jgi:hypothetical protein
MIKVVTAPDYNHYEGKSIFLAGGITSCPEWQNELVDMLRKMNLGKEQVVLYNPRRKNFPIHDPNASNEQITWEFRKLQSSDMIIFWFCRGSINPIVLYELGQWGNSRISPIAIGIDPLYERKQDVIIQTKLARPNIEIKFTMLEIAKEIQKFCLKG